MAAKRKVGASARKGMQSMLTSAQVEQAITGHARCTCYLQPNGLNKGEAATCALAFLLEVWSSEVAVSRIEDARAILREKPEAEAAYRLGGLPALLPYLPERL